MAFFDQTDESNFLTAQAPEDRIAPVVPYGRHRTGKTSRKGVMLFEAADIAAQVAAPGGTP